ncbi:lecithin retinol acyltransferase family protein [Synechococcus sp. CCY 9618]|uniref:lecithin retinol acyltransferase family protein n=1 Tax=Synechococcus sp. CCY 9618 TaxID=2815602 RepID=UPI001C229FBD|nr:lecithin retinol acyltransferase family protein [Synechococcus sp. CCY 9618]
MSAADHLQASRQHGLFLHHGIDLGDGTVAHYLEGREILRSSRDDFSRGETISTVSYPEGSCSPVGVTLRRAMGRIGEQRYNLLFNNCEHFAHWCKTGRHRSAQVEGWLHTGSLGALALGQFVPAALLSGAKVLLRQGQGLAETLATGLDPEQIARGRALALQTLEQLDGLRQRLMERLEEELARAERRWGDGTGVITVASDPLTKARLAAQNLADQLTAVEEMEERLQRLLEPGDDP